MSRENVLRKAFSTLTLGVYLFVALFSQDLHQHGFFFAKNPASEKFAKNVSDLGTDADGANCLSCHFLFTGSTLVPEEFSLPFKSFEDYSDETYATVETCVLSWTDAVSLRGPPLNII